MKHAKQSVFWYMNPNSKPISLFLTIELNLRMLLSLRSPVIMNLHICQRFSFLSFKNPSFLCKPRFSLSHTLRFSSSIENTPLFDLLLHEHQFSPKAASQVASALSCIKSDSLILSIERYDSILTFLRESGFSTYQLEKIVKSRPRLLRGSLDKTIKPKIEIFQGFGFDANDIAEIISKDPLVLNISGSALISALSVLKSFLGSSSEAAKVLKRCVWFLRHDLQKNMVPNIEYLKSCGVEMGQIINHIYNSPRLFLVSHEKMKKFVKTVDEMELSRSSRLFITAVWTVSSMSDENWEFKLKLFKDNGFSEDEILEMFRKLPQVFAISERKLKKVMEVLLPTGKYDTSCIAGQPAVLIASVEERIKPRIEVLTILENKSLLEKWPPISVIYQRTDKQFYGRFVEPFLKYMLEDDKVGNLHPLLKEVGLNQNSSEIFVTSSGMNLGSDSLLGSELK